MRPASTIRCRRSTRNAHGADRISTPDRCLLRPQCRPGQVRITPAGAAADRCVFAYHYGHTRNAHVKGALHRSTQDGEPEATIPPVNPAYSLAAASYRKIIAHQVPYPTPHETAGKHLTHAAQCGQLIVLERLLALFPSREPKGVAVVTRPCKSDPRIGFGATLEVVLRSETPRSAIRLLTLQQHTADFPRESVRP